MSFFSWISQTLGFGSRPEETLGEISTLQLLDSMRKAHSLLDIRISRLNDLRCQSMILAINSDEGYLILDEPFPRTQLGKLDGGDTLNITCRQKNRSPISFNTKLLSRQQHNDGAAYLLELPESIQGDAETKNYRLYVEKENLNIELSCNDETMQGTVIAISFDSIKFHILGQHSQYLSENTEIQNCFLRLTDGELIECSITVQKSFDLLRPLPHTLCTAKLSVAEKSDDKKLSHYLASLQRQQRRRELRLT
jgi:c-di-GMP-binding flagellar brake protein YcgR